MRSFETDAGLGQLKGLVHLRELSLSETQVKDNGVADLQRALPKGSISR
jgi:hypothetical protein